MRLKKGSKEPAPGKPKYTVTLVFLTVFEFTKSMKMVFLVVAFLTTALCRHTIEKIPLI
jgi:hypothetical protein